MLFILLVVLLVIIIGGVYPAWPYSREWGYYPSGFLTIVLVVLLVYWFAVAVRR
jgi:hypothetical protein